MQFYRTPIAHVINLLVAENMAHSNNTSDTFSIDGVKSLYREFIDNNDPRTQNWPLVHTPWPGFLLTALYVYIVKVAGPKYMKNRAPFNIRPLLLVYNFSMVALSAWMFYEFAANGWFVGYNYLCQPIDFSDTSRANRMVWASYVYFLSKYIEFMDTFFFVLRKKFNQITFLHVFHHCAMTLNVWLLVHFGAGGHGTFHALVNSAVHFVMYGYYGLAAIGPGMQRYLWWKRYLTQFQMVQFVIVFLHSMQLFFWTNCDYPKWAALLFSAYPMAFFSLFANFYIQSYKKKHSAKVAWARDPIIGGDADQKPNHHHRRHSKADAAAATAAAAASTTEATTVLLRKHNAAATTTANTVHNSMQNGGATASRKQKEF